MLFGCFMAVLNMEAADQTKFLRDQAAAEPEAMLLNRGRILPGTMLLASGLSCSSVNFKPADCILPAAAQSRSGAAPQCSVRGLAPAFALACFHRNLVCLAASMAALTMEAINQTVFLWYQAVADTEVMLLY